MSKCFEDTECAPFVNDIISEVLYSPDEVLPMDTSVPMKTCLAATATKP